MTPEDRRGRTRRGLYLRLLLALFGIAAITWALGRLGPERVLQAALDADPIWLALSLLPLLARFLIWGHKWHRILDREQPFRFAPALQMLLAGAFVNLTAPTAKLGGGVLRVAVLHKRFGWTLATASGWTVYDQLSNVLGSLSLFGIVALGAWARGPVFEGRQALLPAGVGTLALLLAAIALRPVMRTGLDHVAAESRWRTFLQPVAGPSTGVLLGDLGWAALSFGSICLANLFVLRALGVESEFWTTGAVVVLAYSGGSVIGIWGGVGVTELLLTGLYVRIGIPTDTAVAGALLHRTALYAVVLIWGGASFVAQTCGGRLSKAVSRDSGTGFRQPDPQD